MTPQEIPRFTLAAFFTAPEPCEDALLKLGEAYNKLADLVEEAWAKNAELVEAARPYLEHAAPHEHLFSAEDLRNFQRLEAALSDTSNQERSSE